MRSGKEARHPAAALLQLEVHRGVVGVHDAFLVEPQRVEQRRDGQLAAAVDAAEHDVLGVELEVEPGAAVGDDPAGEQQLARGVRLALVVIEEHAGAAMHLGDDDPLGAVDDEGAVGRHQGHVAHEHVLLLDVLDGLGAGVLVHVEHDQPQRHLEGRGVGHVALLALLDVVLRLLEVVAHELQHGRLVEVLDREHGLEDAHDPLAVGRPLVEPRAQEQVVGRLLDLDEVRHLQHFADLAVVLPESLLADVALGHWSPFASRGRSSRRGPALVQGQQGVPRSIPGDRPKVACPIAAPRPRDDPARGSSPRGG